MRISRNLLIFLLSLFLVSLLIYPIGKLIQKSFTGESGGLSLENFSEAILLNAQNQELLLRTLGVATGSAAVATVLGVLFAWITTRTNTPGRKIFSFLFVMPFYLSPFIGALAWTMIGSDRIGLANVFLKSVLNLSASVINIYSLWGLIFVMGLYYSVWVFLFCSGAFSSMDPSLEEAARTGGANIPQTFFRVTLPIIAPSALSAALLVWVASLGAFAIPSIIGLPRRIYVLSTSIYKYMSFWPLQPNLAAAIAVTLIGFTAAGLFIQRRLLGKRQFYTVTGKAFRSTLIDLGKGKYLTLAACMLHTVIAVILPLFAIFLYSFLRFITPNISEMQFTLNNYAQILLEYKWTSIAIRNSIFIAIIGATLCIFLSLLVSYVILRMAITGKEILDYLAMLPAAIPAVSFAVAILWAYVPTGLYGTLWILLIAYISVNFPIGLRSAAYALRQIHPMLEESARVSGASWLYTIRHVMLPLLKPGLMSGWTILFIMFLREVTSSVLLYSPGNPVFSVVMWDLWRDGVFPEVAALCVIQILIVSVVLLVVNKVIGRVELLVS